MAKRYIGDAVITITYRDRGDYAGTISVPKEKKTWKFDDLHAPGAGLGPGVGYDSPKAYDEMAGSAVAFGGYYTTHNRGDDVPDWAPKPEVADAIDEATSIVTDDQGNYEVRRSPNGKAYSTRGNPRKGRKAKRATRKGKKANPRVFDAGSSIRVSYSAADASSFQSQWPGSTVRGSGWFEFSKSGDLVDVGGSASSGDGDDWAAFAADLQKYGTGALAKKSTRKGKKTNRGTWDLESRAGSLRKEQTAARRAGDYAAANRLAEEIKSIEKRLQTKANRGRKPTRRTNRRVRKTSRRGR